MKSRISTPVSSLHGVHDAMQALGKAGARGGPPKAAIQPVPLRAGSPPPARDDDRLSRASRTRPSNGS
jgi:hypothetical protein